VKYIKEFEEISSSDFLNESLGDAWERFKKTILDLFSKKEVEQTPKVAPAPAPKIPPKPPLPIFGQHMLYLPHQQGPNGASKLVKIVKGESELDEPLRKKLLNNTPSADPGYSKIKTGLGKDAVLAFLTYQKNSWDTLAKEALREISLPENKTVKQAIDNIKDRKLPKEFLYTVAYIESRLKPKPEKNKEYRGLFQIGKLAWDQLKKINPSNYKGFLAPLNPIKNAQAGHDYILWSYDQFEKKVKT
jgi:hypothetical protein